MEAVFGEELERVGLHEMQNFITEFLKSGKGTPAVQKYISAVSSADDSKLRVYLKGRKYRPKHAWETLLRYAEVRFNEYPESFPETVPDYFLSIFKTGVVGILKSRDHLGRRIIFFNFAKWEPREQSMEQMTATVTLFMDRLLTDEDMMNNGVVAVANCTGLGMKHLKAASLSRILQQINIFYYAYPVKLKAVYYLNVPSYALYFHKLLKPFLSKKVNERLIVSTIDRKFEVLHTNISPNLLPKFLGGVGDNEAALDLSLYNNDNQ